MVAKNSLLTSEGCENITRVATQARAWPFEEARKLIVRTQGKTPDKGYVLFQTGYGPSGLPHSGTFGEVARTTMVRHAFEALTGKEIPTRLISFSDDMDALRKVPSNVPNKDMLEKHLGMPLTRIPDPYGKFESFAHHNNAMLCQFLDAFGFEYSFASSSHYYRSGLFDKALLGVLANFEKIMAILLPTLGPERRATYSPFLPISPSTGRVLQVPTLERDIDSGTIVFEDEGGKKLEVPVTGGHVKLQWKPDWAMRQFSLGVDYEMSGKDLIDSSKLAARLVKVLGGRAVDGFSYELFLDEKGQKISKSKGNGLTMDDWLAYAPQESLAYFMYQKPRTAKRLYFDVVPRAVDDYMNSVEKARQALEEKQFDKLVENPVWHTHSGHIPHDLDTYNLSFSLLLNLVSAANASDKSILWGFIRSYAPQATPENAPFLDLLVGYAIRYFEDFVKPAKVYRKPDERERRAMENLAERLEKDFVEHDGDVDALQSLVFSVGREYEFEPLRDWFKALYQVLLGQEQGPRFGSFIALYGCQETVKLIRQKIL